MYKIHKNRHFSSNVQNLKKYGGKSTNQLKTVKDKKIHVEKIMEKISQIHFKQKKLEKKLNKQI